MHVLKLHISIQSLTNMHAPILYHEPFGWSYLQTYNEVPVNFAKPGKKNQNFVGQTKIEMQINLEVTDDIYKTSIFLWCRA